MDGAIGQYFMSDCAACHWARSRVCVCVCVCVCACANSQGCLCVSNGKGRVCGGVCAYMLSLDYKIRNMCVCVCVCVFLCVCVCVCVCVYECVPTVRLIQPN